MEKRTLLALALSIVVLVAWSHFFKREEPLPPVDRGTLSESPTAVVEAPVTAGSGFTLPPTGASQETIVTVESELYRAEFSNLGAQLVSFRLKHYKDADGLPVELLSDLAIERGQGTLGLHTYPPQPGEQLAGALFEVVGGDIVLSERDRPATLTFSYADAEGRAVEKIFRFEPMSHVIDLEVRASLPGAERIFATLGPGFGLSPADSGNRYMFAGRALVQTGTKFERLLPEKVDLVQVFHSMGEVPLGSAGLETSYFAGLLLPQDRDLAEVAVWPDGGFLETPLTSGEEPSSEEEASDDDLVLLRVGVRIDGPKTALRLYMGPKDLEILEGVRPDLRGVVDFGFFGWLAEVLLWALRGLYGYVGNWGVAIILLTAIIRVLFFPLSYKQMLMSKKMQKVQPLLKQLEQKYKKPTTDRAERMKRHQELQQKKMEVLKEQGVNPMSGCLPLLLQLPFLWAFYSLLGAAIELRQAPFALWIEDLSLRDPTYVLPILMGLSMLVQQVLMPTTADPSQKKMMMMMPIMFLFFFLNFPAGLVLYWLTSNVVSIGQQLLLNRYAGDAGPALAAGGKRSKGGSQGRKGRKKAASRR